MKKSIFLSLLLLLPVFMAAQTRKVAILETVDRENTLSYGVKLMVRSHLAEAVTNTPGYEAYDRTNLQQIFDEQEFQRTGFVSDEDIKKIGEMTGVQYVLVAEASKLDERNLFITAKILNVETARVEKTANIMTQTDISSLQANAQDLASRLLAEIKTTKTASPLVSANGAYIERLGTSEYLIGGQPVNTKAYYQFLKDNRVACTAAYKEFQKGKRLAISGWSVMGIGMAVLSAGIIYECTYKEGFLRDESVILMSVGCGIAVAAGIPLVSVGYARKNNAYKAYNEYCGSQDKKTAVTLNLQSSRNGLGLALCF